MRHSTLRRSKITHRTLVAGKLATVVLLAMPTTALPQVERPASRAATLPESVDLNPRFQAFDLSPRVQGDRGTCSVFVITQAIEFALAKRSGRAPDRLSVEFLNWASNDVNGDSADGGFFSDLWSGFEDHGICTEETLPYKPTFDAAAQPSETARTQAAQLRGVGLRLHWIKEWDPNRGLTDDELHAVKETLANGWPVGGGFLWPVTAVWMDGVLQMCARDSVFDGHSVLLVGYRDDPDIPGGGVFLIRNSGGPSRDGFLTYEYAQAYMNDAVWVDHAGADAGR